MVEDGLPPGLYETPLQDRLLRLLGHRRTAGWRSWDAEPDGTSRAEILAQAVYEAAFRSFSSVGQDEQVALANQALALLDPSRPDVIQAPLRVLLELAQPLAGLAKPEQTPRPSLSLRESGLLVNGHRDVQLASELAREIESADRIDLLCAFVRFTGVRLVRPELEAFARRGGKLRVLTSVYTGTTERRALDELVRLGAEVRVSYETGSTRLHAKAWLIHRESGFSTAFVGSSNLTQAALVDGLEWNVRLAELDNGRIFERFRATFEQYWQEPDFNRYTPELDAERLDRALAGERASSEGPTEWLLDLGIEWHPKPHQEAMLEALSAERDAGHMRNLIVAATGTGKTWVAAFDYARLRNEGHERLLFVAHREEILRQSLFVFRLVLGDANFGELLVGGAQPTRGTHLFASIQSLQQRLSELTPDSYDAVIVDEFHHAAAPTYERLLAELKPKVLLGLTATPERMDGRSILEWFDNRVATDTRLWDALEQGLLVPFHYFGVPDGAADLSSLRFSRGRYDAAELENVLTGNDIRVRLILRNLNQYVPDPAKMRALGFCASVAHAIYMAEQFSSAGLPSVTVHGTTPAEERRAAVQRLSRGEIRAIFTVDVFNEGVDIPQVDTVLLLRPTESATIFLQQLGRGLRHSPASGKSVLTVLDFIGQAHRDYRYDVRYAALLGGATRRQVEKNIEHDFPRLPPGCAVKLEPVAKETVLRHLRAFANNSTRMLVEDLHALGPGTRLPQYLAETGVALEEIYARPGRSFTDLGRRAGFTLPLDRAAADWERAFARLLHVDDHARIAAWRNWLSLDEPPDAKALAERERRLWRMLLAALSRREESPTTLPAFWDSPSREELHDLLGVLAERIRRVPRYLDPDGPVPLASHARYGRDEILAAFNDVRPDGTIADVREGVREVKGARTDAFFITLEKSDRDFSPTTRYADYPISPSLFQWESQSTTSVESPTGQRYIHHQTLGSKVLLFVRERKDAANGVTLPYVCLGYARYVSHERDRPIRILWQLERPMPADLFETAKVAAG